MEKILYQEMREVICLHVVAAQNMDCHQRNPRLASLNNLADQSITWSTHSVQIVHHRGAVRLNQDMCSTQIPLDFFQSKETSLLLEIDDMEINMISRPDGRCPSLARDCTLPPSIIERVCCQDICGAGA